MKMKDMPYYHYKKQSKDKTGSDQVMDPDVKDGDIEILRKKFNKYHES